MWAFGLRGVCFVTSWVGYGERIDCLFATTDWLNVFPNARLFHLAASVSDHCCLMLRFN